MTWEELLKKAKELGYSIGDNDNFIRIDLHSGDCMCLYKGGGIVTTNNEECRLVDMTYGVTPEQMYQLIQELGNNDDNI